MPNHAIHITFFFFLLTALSGAVMRYMILMPEHDFMPFDFILHGHSHMAILGWTFLGVFLIFLRLVWEELHAKKQAIGIIITTLIITICMFLAFLYQGYALYSIILSTLHIGIEYWMAIFMFKTMKRMTSLPPYSKLFMKGAFISLIISSIGPFALGGIGMAGMKESPFFEMAIYFFLHFQYNGWLYLMLFGTFLLILHKKHIFLDRGLVSSSFWIYMISLLPAYVLSILWYGLGWFGKALGIVGAFGQFTGIVILLIAILKAKKQIRQTFSRHIQLSLLFIFLLLAIKAFMEFGLLYEPFATSIFNTRSVVIGYLHLMLLGFISLFILTQYQMTALLDEQKKTVLYGLAVFIFGFLLNEGVLFLMGLFGWLDTAFPFGNELLLIASMLLFAGIAIVWSSLFNKSAT